MRPDERLRLGPFQLDPIERSALKAGRPLALTPTEFDLLEALCADRGPSIRACSCSRACRPELDLEGDRVIDVHIANLRKKIEADPGRPRHLLTVRAVGYRLLEGE